MLFRPETSVTLTPMLARKFQTNVRLMLTAMRDLLESVLLMMMVRLLSANTVNPMVSTTSVNQVLISISISISIIFHQAASITRTLMRFPDVQLVLTIAMSIPTTAKPLQGQPY